MSALGALAELVADAMEQRYEIARGHAIHGWWDLGDLDVLLGEDSCRSKGFTSRPAVGGREGYDVLGLRLDGAPSGDTRLRDAGPLGDCSLCCAIRDALHVLPPGHAPDLMRLRIGIPAAWGRSDKNCHA